MARSIQLAVPEHEGTFTHQTSGTQFTISGRNGEMWQTLVRQGQSQSLPMKYSVGSGAHATGFIAQVGDHLLQSPISYYDTRGAWDVAPGYENATAPDFSRPVTVECLNCHADQPRAMPNTVNTYQSPALTGLGIQCDRCHGPAAEHLRHPVAGSIVNPEKLPIAARDSVCEQCHLAGEIRIPNPGKTIGDFRPGQRLEDVYTVYVQPQTAANGTVKVISQSEQLRKSKCAVDGKLWCASCHNPHSSGIRPVSEYRAVCLTCHAATLNSAHAAPDRNCVGCHMPKRPAKDGGHTAFTDHRIARFADVPEAGPFASELKAWREPAANLVDRNQALALVTVGLEDGNSGDVIRGFKTLNRIQNGFGDDPAIATALGTILLKAKQPDEAIMEFSRALRAKPGYAPYQVNLGAALLANNRLDEAASHLEAALNADPLLSQAVELLSELYRQQGKDEKAEQLKVRYRSAFTAAAK